MNAKIETPYGLVEICYTDIMNVTEWGYADGFYIVMNEFFVYSLIKENENESTYHGKSKIPV